MSVSLPHIVLFVTAIACVSVNVTLSAGKTLLAISYALDVHKNDRVFTNNVAFESRAISETICARTCSTDKSCVTFTFINDSDGTFPGGSCRGHSANTSDTTTTWAQGARTYTMVVADDTEWLGMTCTSDQECRHGNAACFSGTCVCTPGYFYSIEGNSCQPTCPSSDLKNVMARYPGSAIVAGNLDNSTTTLPPPVEREACLDHCRSTPLCLAVDYDIVNLKCHRKYETALTAPWMWARWAEYDHYQRSCV